MRLTWLGWAGVELEADGATVVIDPLQDAGAVFAPLGEPASSAPLPQVVPARAGRAVAGLVTHLHRDHADAAALATALVPGAPVFEPPAGDGDELEELALAQADRELTAAGLDRRRLAPWASATAGPVHADRAPGRRRRRRPAGRVARRGRRGPRPAPRRHDAARGLVAHGAAATARSTWCSSRSTARSSASRTAARPARCRSSSTPTRPRSPPGSSVPAWRSRSTPRATRPTASTSRSRTPPGASSRRPRSGACRCRSSAPARRSRSSRPGAGRAARRPSERPAGRSSVRG